MLLVGVLGLASGLIASTPTSATGTCDPAGTPFGGGTGTEADPYLVCAPTHLDNVGDELTKSFVQTANIDLDIAPYNTGDGWAPIAVGAPGVFSGNFDGGRYVISNLFINRPATDFSGLFGALDQVFTPIMPTRVLDTRRNLGAIGPLAAGSITRITVAGVGSIPAAARAITGTLTAVAGSSAGYATLFACEEPRPGTSTLNLAAGQTIANVAIGAVDTSGDLCLYTSVSANYLLDISGWLVASR